MSKLIKAYFVSIFSIFSCNVLLQEQALLEPSEYSYEERASLCLLAIKWYNIEKTEETLEIISQLEKKVWLFKIKAQVNNNVRH